MTGGGNPIPMPILTSAIVGTGTTIVNAKSIAPKSNFFILLSPFNKGYRFHRKSQFSAQT